MNRVRIIGGAWRSRLIEFPDLPDLRPTPDRVRETLFNWLGQDLTGLDCLDPFAGSGALGFEALSRGAARVVMVETHARAFRALEANAGKLQPSGLELRRGDGLQFLAAPGMPFDLIFLDPPFAAGLLQRALRLAAGRLNPGGRVYVESGAEPEPGPGWEVVKRGHAGQVHHQLLRATADVLQGDLPGDLRSHDHRP